MDKLKMAHEWAMNTINAGYCNETKLMVKEAWAYADAMQAEADKRINKERPEALCEVDWCVAPGWAKYHQDGPNGHIWVCENFEKIENAPSFGFTGSHIVGRPDVF